MIGKRLDELFAPDLVAVCEPYYRRGFEGEQTQFEFDVFGHTYHMSVAPVFDEADGRVSQIVVVTQDISARKRDEDPRNSFVATLAHELSQPLSAMRPPWSC